MTMIMMMISKMINILVKTIISGFTCRQREGDKKKDKIQLKELRAEDKFSIKYDFLSKIVVVLSSKYLQTRYAIVVKIRSNDDD